VDSHQPIHVKYLRRDGPDLWNANARPLGENGRGLATWRSDGIVAGCHLLPREFQMVANGAFCRAPAFSAAAADGRQPRSPMQAHDPRAVC
jgi:hypothetical protein